MAVIGEMIWAKEIALRIGLEILLRCPTKGNRSIVDTAQHEHSPYYHICDQQSY